MIPLLPSAGDVANTPPKTARHHHKALPGLRLRHIRLQDFRNHERLELHPDGASLVISGPNGSGKTSILESVSLFGSPRGLRRAALENLLRIPLEDHAPPMIPRAFRVAARFAPHGTPDEDRTAVVAMDADSPRRVNRMGEDPVTVGRLVRAHPIVWLTPDMFGLMAGKHSERRRYIDRMIRLLDPEHERHLIRYESLVRQRSRLLGQPRFDPTWCTLLEEKIAALGVLVVANRREYVAHLERQWHPLLPRLSLSLCGPAEDSVEHHTAESATELATKQLHARRRRDAATGGASFGPHISELHAQDLDQRRRTDLCSLGESKMVMLSVLVGCLRLQHALGGFVPLVLLDEITSHFDSRNTSLLWSVLEDLGAQTIIAVGERQGALWERQSPAPGSVEHLRLTPGPRGFVPRRSAFHGFPTTTGSENNGSESGSGARCDVDPPGIGVLSSQGSSGTARSV